LTCQRFSVNRCFGHILEGCRQLGINKKHKALILAQVQRNMLRTFPESGENFFYFLST